MKHCHFGIISHPMEWTVMPMDTEVCAQKVLLTTLMTQWTTENQREAQHLPINSNLATTEQTSYCTGHISAFHTRALTHRHLLSVTPLLCNSR